MKISPIESFNGLFDIPSSKSYANRALILSFIFRGQTQLWNLPESTDVHNLKLCLDKIQDCFWANCERSAIDLYPGDGGTTTRFLIALLSRSECPFRVHLSEQMAKRPIEELLEILIKHGVTIERDDDSIFIQGPIQIPKRIAIDCSRTGQFASALMLAFADTDCKVIPFGLEASRRYVDLTQFLVEQFRNNLKHYEVPADFSSLSYPAALGVVCGGFHAPNCSGLDPLQADSLLFDWLERAGGKFMWKSDGLHVEKSDLQGASFDASVAPDLVPTIAFLASRSMGKTVISQMEVLKYKETDRIRGVLNLLRLFNVMFEYDDKNYELKIQGNPKLKAPPVECELSHDHRIVMACYLFLRVNQGGTLSPTSAVQKSFPEFFELMDEKS